MEDRFTSMAQQSCDPQGRHAGDGLSMRCAAVLSRNQTNWMHGCIPLLRVQFVREVEIVQPNRSGRLSVDSSGFNSFSVDTSCRFQRIFTRDTYCFRQHKRSCKEPIGGTSNAGSSFCNLGGYARTISTVFCCGLLRGRALGFCLLARCATHQPLGAFRSPSGYEPAIQRSGRDGVIGRHWFSGVSYWCERVPNCTIDRVNTSESASTSSPRGAQ